MSGGFAFIVLASHGSGVHALHAYLTMLPGVECLLYPKSKEQIEIFLKSGGIKGVILDSSAYMENGIFDCILKNLEGQTLAIVLSRDPVERLNSVVNTHILWFAQSASGVFEKSTVFPFSGIPGLLDHVIHAKTMDSVPGYTKCIHEKADSMLFFDMSDIYPEKYAHTLSKIAKYLSIPERERERERENLTNCMPFGKENRFFHKIKRLRIHDKNLTFSLVPCLTAFCHEYGYAEDVIITTTRDECGFFLGDNALKEISFVCIDYDHCSRKNAKRILSHILSRDWGKIRNYCLNISARNGLAKQIAENLYLTDKKLLDTSEENRTLGHALDIYVENEIQNMTKYCPEQLMYWERTLALHAELKGILRG
ncbi:hypothetical protein [uncultured Desulfovibrio sp.]|uniref:hypothetical protein n=1 Tax=uncultured Desulfovibrio sp. TaxID=167968 RepID=UPI002806146D|nr:hypothetical protein [uncultured Desulfovibrio sp.]